MACVVAEPPRDNRKSNTLGNQKEKKKKKGEGEREGGREVKRERDRGRYIREGLVHDPSSDIHSCAIAEGCFSSCCASTLKEKKIILLRERRREGERERRVWKTLS